MWTLRGRACFHFVFQYEWTVKAWLFACCVHVKNWPREKEMERQRWETEMRDRDERREDKAQKKNNLILPSLSTYRNCFGVNLSVNFFFFTYRNCFGTKFEIIVAGMVVSRLPFDGVRLDVLDAKSRRWTLDHEIHDGCWSRFSLWFWTPPSGRRVMILVTTTDKRTISADMITDFLVAFRIHRNRNNRNFMRLHSFWIE